MTQLLSDQEQSHVISATASHVGGSHSPSIFRFITESRFSARYIFYTKLLLASFFAGVFLVSIVFQGITLSQNLEMVQAMRLERGNVAQEIGYWKQISTQYQGYRDVYFRIAALEYKIGEVDESKKYMDKALQLDPNFGAGKVLGEKIKEK